MSQQLPDQRTMGCSYCDTPTFRPGLCLGCMEEASTVCVAALRENWQREATPREVVGWMFDALDRAGNEVVPRSDHARRETEAMVGMVFADLSGEEFVDYNAVVSNALRQAEACRGIE